MRFFIGVNLLSVLFYFPSLLFGQDKNLLSEIRDSEVKILKVGDYKVGELDTNLLNNEWWGIFEINNRSYIKKVFLKLENIKPDIQYDWQYRIVVKDYKNCKILMSGLDLSERTIDAYADLVSIRSNNNFTFEFGPYHTYLSSKLIVEKENCNTYLVNLNYDSNTSSKSQELFEFDKIGYSKLDNQLVVTLEWAGDIDNDGKTDLLIQIPNYPNNEIGYSLGLFLSSKAEPHDLVKLVASFSESGC